MRCGLEGGSERQLHARVLLHRIVEVLEALGHVVPREIDLATTAIDLAQPAARYPTPRRHHGIETFETTAHTPNGTE